MFFKTFSLSPMSETVGESVDEKLLGYVQFSNGSKTGSIPFMSVIKCKVVLKFRILKKNSRVDGCCVASSSLLLGDIESSTTGSSPSTAPAQQKPTEPNIDFELDVKVLINRGKCVLHTKDQAKEDELKMYVFQY